jgi:hypothetical protein
MSQGKMPSSALNLIAWNADDDREEKSSTPFSFIS